MGWGGRVEATSRACSLLLAVLRGPDVVSEIEPGSVLCEASTLLTTVSLAPGVYLKKNIYNSVNVYNI